MFWEHTDKCFLHMNLLCLAAYSCLALKHLDSSRIQRKNQAIKVTDEHRKKGMPWSLFGAS